MKIGSILAAVPSSWRRGIVNALGGTFHSASDNASRTTTVYFPLDSTREIEPGERRELVKKHRSLRNNLGFVRGIINTTVRLSIGWGLQPVPRSGDKDFDRRALAYWRRATRKQSFDVAAQDTEAAMQRLVMREVITDGELFAIKVFDDFGRPQRQLIKTEQIGNPSEVPPSDNWQDGIWLNSLRRPLRYGVIQTPLSGSPAWPQRVRPVEAKDMLHIYDRERATQCHGLPWGYNSLNHGVDAIDILAFEKIAHKLNSAIVGSMTTPTGDPAKGMEVILAAAKQAAAAGATQSSTERTKDGVKYLDLHGTMIPIFKAGESMQFYNGRNSVNAIEFAGGLCAQYAYGFGTPVEFVVGLASGGANVRGMAEIAGRFFEDNQMLLIDDWCQPNWENIIGTGILAAQFPRDFPLVEPLAPPRGWTGWDVVEWRGPKNITMDKGRDGKTYLDLKRAGWMSDEEFWTLNGEDPDEMPVKIDEELAARRARWVDDLGLPEDKFWIREFGTNLSGQTASAEPAPAPVAQ